MCNNTGKAVVDVTALRRIRSMAKGALLLAQSVEREGDLYVDDLIKAQVVNNNLEDIIASIDGMLCAEGV